MVASRIEPTHTLEGHSHIRFLWLGRGFRLQWHAGIQKLAYGRGLSASGGFLQHHLRRESFKVEFLFSQCRNQLVPALDPSLGSSKSVNLIFQFGDDRRHSLPLADVVSHFFFVAIDCNGEHVSRVVCYRSSVASSHGIKVGSDESLSEIANFIRIYTVRVLSGSNYETAAAESDALCADCH